MKNLNASFTLLIALAILLSACGPSPAANVAQSNLQRETHPPVLEGDVENLVNGNNTFALELYRSLAKQNGNLVYSPFSISLALAMTYAGARGETESQMADVLHFPLGQNSTHPAFNALDLGLAQRGQSTDKKQEPMQLNLANAVWAEQTYPFQQDFLDTIAVNYGAGVRLADFINQYESVRKEINRWVEDQTRNKIKDLLSDGTLNSDTRMALVNAIYFKADWLTAFDANDTHDAPFHLLDGSEAQVKMMSNGLYVPYVRGDGYQAVELPYAGGTAAMDILVPDEGNFEAFDSTLDSAAFDAILAAMQPASVQVGLPKFQFTGEFSLPDQLSALGMTDAFDPNLADFSGMTGDRDLFISDVIHKAFVAVDEKGTEAAAATAVIMELTGAPMFENVLIIDRPFLFVIRDTASGQILFMGRVVNPAK